MTEVSPAPPIRPNPSARAYDLLGLLVEQVTDYAIITLDANGNVASWNAGAERIKGYTSSDILGKHFSTFYRPEDLWKCDTEIATAKQFGRVEDEGFRVRKDGSLFWANVVITTLRDEHGEIVGFGKVTRDLTERRIAEETLRQSEERFRLIVQSVKDYAIFMLDPAGHVATWNGGAAQIKGYSAEEIIGRHFSVFYSAEEVRAGKCEYELQVAARVGRVEDEGWRIRKDGTRFWANVVITTLRSTTGEIVGFAKVTRDLTERRAAEEERLRMGRLAQERIKVLTEVTELLTGAFSVDDVARVVTTSGTQLAHADTCTLYLLDERSRVLELIAERGCKPEAVELMRRIAPDSENPAYAVGSGSEGAIWVESEAEYRRLYPMLAGALDEAQQVRAFGCVPLIAEGKAIGLLGVGFLRERQVGTEERQLVETFARQCAQALARARRVEAERASAALAESLRLSLATTLRSIGDAVIATDAQGRITLMNGVAEALTGWSEQESRGKPLDAVFRIRDERSGDRARTTVEEVLKEGKRVQTLETQTLLSTRDGRQIPIEHSGAPIRSESESAEGVVLVFRDTSARRRAESRRAFLTDASAVLGQSLDYEQTVARVAELCVPTLADWCAIDMLADGAELKRLALVHVDPAKVALAWELDAKYPQSLGSRTALTNVLRTGRAESYARVSPELLGSLGLDAERLQFAPRSALFVPLTVRGCVLGVMSFIYAESGRSYSADDLEFAEDFARRCAPAIENARLFTAEQNSRRNADVANRAKDEFLAIVSHELRTPLNAIMGWAKLLSSLEFDEQRRHRATDTIERNAVAMGQLIEDLLDMSRITSGKMRLEVQTVDLARVVASALDSIRPAAAARGVDLSSISDSSVGPLIGDPTRLQQIVWNLLSNAVKFTPQGGRVSIVTRRLESAVEISVSDSGKGIDPAFLPYVFDQFRQEDASATRSKGGLGLGLAITRQLVELHGGKVSASSEGAGKGATFVVSLPISTATVSPPKKEPAVRINRTSGVFERPERLRGLRVLVVDDEPDARELVATVLEECGCEVTMAANVNEAMQRVADEVPDVLLSDVGMPEQTGYDLIRRIRNLPHDHGGDIPAAALTAYARPEDRRNLLNAGYSIHLPKPVEPAELVAVVASLSRFVQRIA